MKATGVIRRVDSLGRLVIPSEIRRSMRIREGDPLELYTDKDGVVILKKYSPVGEQLGVFAADYAETLHRTCSLCVVITDRDAVIATAGIPRKFAEKPVTEELEQIMENRSLYQYREGEESITPIAEENSFWVRCAMPILSEGGDIVGSVVSLGGTEGDKKLPSADVEVKLIQTAASFLGRQLES